MKKLFFTLLFAFTILYSPFSNPNSHAATPVLVDRGNGTIEDTANNLVWLKNANCFGLQNWNVAITSANTLASGSCGLTDGSQAGDWHLPTIDELRIFTDSGLRYDTLNAAGFIDVRALNYWSSTAHPSYTDNVWSVNMNGGGVGYSQKLLDSFVWPVRPLYKAPVPKTGQTTSYAAGDDGDKQAGVASPSPRFTDTGDGTVADNLTGLIWLKNANCFGQKNWTDAVSLPRTLQNGQCGLNDGSTAGQWYLPSVKELDSLVDFQNTSPALPTGAPFTNIQSGGIYWSSSTFATLTNYAWLLDSTLGFVTYERKILSASPNDGTPFYVWPVRLGNVTAPAPVSKTGQSTSYATGDDGDLKPGITWPTPRFVDNNDGTVTDMLTGLIWLKNANCTETIAGIDKTSALSWNNSIAWSNNLVSGKCGLTDNSVAGDWRMPNRKELMSLMTYNISGTSIPTGHPFLNIQQGSALIAYWTSTTSSFAPSNAWLVNMDVGGGGDNLKSVTSVQFVWPVRNKKSETLGTLNISKSGSGTGSVSSTPAGITCGATCTASFTSGQSVTLTAAPDSGSTFASWSGCDSTNANQCTVAVTGTKNVAATFNLTNPPVNGVCGSTNNANLYTKPSGGLCTVGSASTVSATATGWSWTCSGTNGGTTASCTANIMAYPSSAIFLDATSKTPSFNLGWQHSPSYPVTYVIQESTDGGTNYTQIATTTSNIYTLSGKANGSYRYRIKATKTNYVDSAWTVSKPITVALTCYPTYQLYYNATSSDSSFNLGWQHSLSYPAVTYAVEESTDGGTNYSQIGTTASNQYTVTGKANGNYKYRVKTTKTGYADSGYSNPATVTVNLTVTAPNYVGAYVPPTGNLSVSWTGSPQGADSYTLETSGDGANWTLVQDNITTRSYNAPRPASGNRWYRVHAHKTGWADSAWAVTSRMVVP